ncbi:MAG: hypothetical protein RIS84_721 [Pseudomonadota bacterium]|jgi:4-alpha-glucanotransferase
MQTEFFSQRRAGVLLHPTSLPGTLGNGDFGAQAYRFVDFLAASGLSVWQVLPLNPPHSELSPYQCQSSHAGNLLLVDLTALEEKGWLAPLEIAPESVGEQRCQRLQRLAQAYHGFKQVATLAEQQAFQEFCAQQAHWLDDYALFHTLKRHYQQAAWWEWLPEHRNYQASALQQARLEFTEMILEQKFGQFIFFQQWLALKAYANAKGVFLFGDMPIFVAEDSADVWANRGYFLLDEHGRPSVVAGVPPDYFSATGQRWGNPLYDWDKLQADNFAWWLQRLKTAELLFDVIRIDHFRGFEACWTIPATEKTAEHGEWVKVAGEALFDALLPQLHLPVVAEDLGVITPEVEALRHKYHFPGMKILQFAFDSDASNPYLPHNHEPNGVVYTGTHDNDTTLGWFHLLSPTVQAYALEYAHAEAHQMPWKLIELGFASVAKLVMIPMQDILSLDGSHRMNLPGTVKGNWEWRFSWSQLLPEHVEQLRHLSRFYGRDGR